MSIVATLCIGTIPKLVPAQKDPSGYPKYLGEAGNCGLMEVSPMTKISPNTVFRVPSDVSESTITRSMAKNEFESVQIVVSNWGAQKIEVLDVDVHNNTKDGLTSAFSGASVIKDWKGEEWEWPLFEAKFVDTIQPGYPNILYDFHGDQTHAQIVKGQNDPRPKAIVEPGKSLSIWLTFYTPESIASGEYSDKISIQTSAWESQGLLLGDAGRVDEKLFKTQNFPLRPTQSPLGVLQPKRHGYFVQFHSNGN